MAAYPSYMILDTSDVERVDGYLPVRASNGAIKVRKMSADEPRVFVVDHILTQAERDTYEAFYQANKLLDITLNWPGEGALTVRYIAAPKYSGPSGLRLYRVQARLAQV